MEGGHQIQGLANENLELRAQVARLNAEVSRHQQQYNQLLTRTRDVVRRKLQRRSKLKLKMGLACTALVFAVFIAAADVGAVVSDVLGDRAENKDKRREYHTNVVNFCMGSLGCSSISLCVVLIGILVEVWMEPKSIPWKGFIEILMAGLAFIASLIIFLGKAGIIHDKSFMEKFMEWNAIVRIAYLCAGMSLISISHLIGPCVISWALLGEVNQDLDSLRGRSVD